MWWAWRKGWGPGLTVTMVEGSHVPGSVWPAVVVVCGGWMTGRLVTGILTRVCRGSCWVAVSAVVVGAGGRGARVVVGGGSWLGRGPWAGVVSGGFVSLRMRCCVWSRGRRLGFGVGFGVGVRFGFGVGFGVGVRFQVEEYLCPEV